MLSTKQVVKRTGLSVSTIRRQVLTGNFPSSRQLTPNRIGWSEEEIDAWEQSRPSNQIVLQEVE
ncbi:MAG: AlpA family phage regulatory protein [Verrucomicrobiales bacterium]|nr:AlpA family phage regulatory protein [Verrucomicrobiales bacterium]